MIFLWGGERDFGISATILASWEIKCARIQDFIEIYFVKLFIFNSNYDLFLLNSDLGINLRLWEVTKPENLLK